MNMPGEQVNVIMGPWKKMTLRNGWKEVHRHTKLLLASFGVGSGSQMLGTCIVGLGKYNAFYLILKPLFLILCMLDVLVLIFTVKQVNV